MLDDGALFVSSDDLLRVWSLRRGSAAGSLIISMYVPCDVCYLIVAMSLAGLVRRLTVPFSCEDRPILSCRPAM